MVLMIATDIDHMMVTMAISRLRMAKVIMVDNILKFDLHLEPWVNIDLLNRDAIGKMKEAELMSI